MSFFGGLGDVLKKATPLGWAASAMGGDGSGIPDASSIHNFYNDPMNSGLQGIMNQYKAVADSGGGPSYSGQGGMQGPLAEYDTMRQRATQSQNQQTAQNQEHLDRQFASMGMSNSGAAIKQGQLNSQQGQENLANTMGQIGTQEAQTRRGLQEQDLNRQFQSGEAAKQRGFGALQGELGAQSADLGFKNAQQEQAYNNYNAELNNYTQKHSGGLLGSGGFLGTGIGA